VLCAVVLAASQAAAQEPNRFVRLSTSITARAVERGVLREQRVELASAASLFETGSDRTVQLDLFPDLSVMAVRERVEISPAGRVWIGTARPTTAGVSDLRIE
jgi:hypothetical protein